MIRRITVQSCPVCKEELIRGESDFIKIGSPLVTCYKCGRTYKTHLRTEWCHYSPKIRPFLLPLFFALGVMLMSLSKGFWGALLGALMGFGIGIVFFGIPNLVRIISSIVRMRKPEYLRKLLDHGVIFQFEYDERMKGRK